MKAKDDSPLSQSGPQPLWDASRDYLRIVLRDVEVEARVGAHPWEMHPERPSRLILNIEMFALAGRRLDEQEAIIDYDQIHGALKAWPGRPHVRYLETLLEELAELCLRNPRVMACRVSILKPDIFNDVAGVGVELYRRREA
jgi:dihydroneopterin aldolase